MLRSFPRKFANTTRRLSAFLKMELEHSKETDFDISLLRRGFFSQKKYIYDFSKYNDCFFLTDWEVEFNIPPVNRSASRNIVSDKGYFSLFLSEHENPQFIGILNNRQFIPRHKETSIPETLKEFGSLLLKPVRGSGGKGIKKIKDISELNVDGTFAIELPIIPHEYSKTIFPFTLNTIRVITLVDSQGIFVGGAAHRFGSSKTGVVDNFGKGGLASSIDIKTGELTAAKSTFRYNNSLLYKAHPDTNQKIESVIVPFWEETKDLALELAARFSDLPHIGWDIAITSNGPVIVEGNAYLANPDVVQASSPLLIDPRVLEFMRFHSVISSKHYERVKRELPPETKNRKIKRDYSL